MTIILIIVLHSIRLAYIIFVFSFAIRTFDGFQKKCRKNVEKNIRYGIRGENHENYLKKQGKILRRYSKSTRKAAESTRTSVESTRKTRQRFTIFNKYNFCLFLIRRGELYLSDAFGPMKKYCF